MPESDRREHVNEIQLSILAKETTFWAGIWEHRYHDQQLISEILRSKKKKSVLQKTASFEKRSKLENEKKIFINYISDRWLVPKTYRELEKTLNIKKTNDLNKKWGTKLNEEFPKNKIQMINKHFKNSQHP